MAGKVEWGDKVKVVKSSRTGTAITTQVAGASGKLVRVFVKYDKPRPHIGGGYVTGEWWEIDQVEAVGQSNPSTQGDEMKVKVTPDGARAEEEETAELLRFSRWVQETYSEVWDTYLDETDPEYDGDERA